MSPLHFRKTSDSTTALDMRARRADIIRPLCEKTLSTGAELAGMRNSLSNSGRNTVKSRNRVLPVQTKSGRKCRSWCRWCSRSCLDGSSVPGSRSAMTCGSGQTMLSWPECFEAEARSSRSRPNFWPGGQSGLEALTSLLTRRLCWCRQLAVRHWVIAGFRRTQQEPGIRCFVVSGTCLPCSPYAVNSRLYCLGCRTLSTDSFSTVSWHWHCKVVLQQ